MPNTTVKILKSVASREWKGVRNFMFLIKRCIDMDTCHFEKLDQGKPGRQLAVESSVPMALLGWLVLDRYQPGTRLPLPSSLLALHAPATNKTSDLENMCAVTTTRQSDATD